METNPNLTVTIHLNSRFYREDALSQAIEDFKGVCKGRILNDKFDIVLKPHAPVDNLPSEFSNYVLLLMGNQRET